jgi:hypothetical protein
MESSALVCPYPATPGTNISEWMAVPQEVSSLIPAAKVLQDKKHAPFLMTRLHSPGPAHTCSQVSFMLPHRYMLALSPWQGPCGSAARPSLLGVQLLTFPSDSETNHRVCLKLCSFCNFGQSCLDHMDFYSLCSVGSLKTFFGVLKAQQWWHPQVLTPLTRFGGTHS